MNNRFVITGPPGSGKTPLVCELRSLGFGGVEEPARAILSEQRAIDGSGVYDRDRRLFWDLMLARALSDFHQSSGAALPVFFDRGIPDLVGYADLFVLDGSDAVRVAETCRYEEVAFALPSWPEIYVTDDERRMTFEAASAFGECVRRVYVDLGYEIVEVPPVAVSARAAFVIETLRRLGKARR